MLLLFNKGQSTITLGCFASLVESDRNWQQISPAERNCSLNLHTGSSFALLCSFVVFFFLLVHLWECHPKPKRGRQNKPMQRQTLPAESADSPPSLLPSLPALWTNTPVPVEATWRRERRPPAPSPTSVDSHRWEWVLNWGKPSARPPRGLGFLEVFRLLGVTSCPNDGGGREASPPWKVSAHRGKPQLVFSLCKQPPPRPPPRIDPSLPSPFQTTQWHINKHAAHTNTAHSCTPAGRERRVGELMHFSPQPEDCEHSENKYPVLIIKFSSGANLSEGQVHFLVKNTHT